MKLSTRLDNAIYELTKIMDEVEELEDKYDTLEGVLEEAQDDIARLNEEIDMLESEQG